MTGSSLDGIDLAYCHLEENQGKWNYKIEIAECVPMAPKWKQRIQGLVLQNAVTYLKTDAHFGHYLGETVEKFVADHQLEGKVDFVSSHGQTVFHQPENHMTSQIGDGAAISAKCGLPVICNFRTQDVSLGGQGTPIAPIADKLFFGDFKFCLNIGGIANLSFKTSDGGIIGFDSCGANLVLNSIANELNLEFDEDGNLARNGQVNQELLTELNSQWYFEKAFPKSIGGGWVTKIFLPLFRKHHISVEDKMRTAIEHIVMQISKDVKAIYQHQNLESDPSDTMLVTGGGAFNKMLMESLSEYSPVQLVIPDTTTIKFKEALIMALMGALRVSNQVNVLASVTGAKADSIGGEIHQSTKKIL